MARPKTSKLSSSESREAIEIFGTFQERGFSISKDKNGFFIHTHRSRSKSDAADLDFGMYRIMNYKRKQTEKFIDDLIEEINGVDKVINADKKQ